MEPCPREHYHESLKNSPRSYLLISCDLQRLICYHFFKKRSKMFEKYKQVLGVSSQNVTFLSPKIFYDNSFWTVISRKDKKHIPEVIFIQALNSDPQAWFKNCVYFHWTPVKWLYSHFDYFFFTRVLIWPVFLWIAISQKLDGIFLITMKSIRKPIKSQNKYCGCHFLRIKFNLII
jgi:hypothetical protein